MSYEGKKFPTTIYFHVSRTANSTRDEDRDEVSSTVSYLSDISGLSELSGQDWKPVAGKFKHLMKLQYLN